MRDLAAGFGRGAAIGLAWGVLARLFMRLISTQPSFSWLGTAMILLFSALLWGLIGVVAAARAGGRSRWWRLAPLPGLFLFGGAGLVMLPGIVAVGLALLARGQRWRVWLVAAASVGMYTLVKVLEDETLLGPRTQTLGNVLMVAATVWMGFGMHSWWRRWEPATTGAGAIAEASPAAYGRI